jgi:hypothetical protein
MRRVFALAGAVLGLASSTTPATADIITTLAGQTGGIGDWGSVPSGSTPTYGQTFTATTTNSVLLSITFKIDNFSGVSIPYRAFVIGWTGNDLFGTITGSELFSGPPSSVASTLGVYQAVTQDTGALQLTPGHQYLAAFTTIDQGGTTGHGNWGLVRPGTYSGGGLAYNNATTLAGLTSNWNPNDAFVSDMAFELNFATTPVPAPPAVVLVGLGAGCVAAKRYIHRRAIA